MRQARAGRLQMKQKWKDWIAELKSQQISAYNQDGWAQAGIENSIEETEFLHTEKTVVITGGAGFIGHHIVEHILRNTDWKIVIIDKLNYASQGFARLRAIEAIFNKRVTIFTHDFTQEMPVGIQQEIGSDVNYILHLGAETHVDNSIKNPLPFVMSNVVGTMHMLEYAKTLPSLEWFLYFSTDEVFGNAPDGEDYYEWDRYDSGNPYSATKAGGEELCLAYANTYKLPVLISHCMNVFGERQHYEKYIPIIMKSILTGEELKVHSYPDGVRAGSRFYIHARNVASATLFILRKGEQREKYNIVGQKEVDNLELAIKISGHMDKPLIHKLVDFHSKRPGHDLRYALNGSKLEKLGWEPPVDFEESLKRTIK